MPQSTKKNTVKVRYRNLRDILLADLDRISDAEDCDIHRAFLEKTIHVMSSSASGISITDGSYDNGIDFCRNDSPIFTIAQCKCPLRDALASEGKPHAFDRDALEDLLTGINYILDESGSYPRAPLDLKRFKAAYYESIQEWKNETRLQAALAVLGTLTPQASNYFRNQRNKFRSKGVELLLWDWEKFDDLVSTPQVDTERVSMTLTIADPDTELLRRRDCAVCFARAYDFIEAWEMYQWNIVDWNVRAEIRNSPTNQAIQNTLLNPSGRRHFQDYNNGMLIVCKQIKYADLPGGEVTIKLRQPQVINGCQTLLSLVRGYLDLDVKGQESFRNDVRVQVKIIGNMRQEFVDRIALSTNDQNPMSSRNLKSNRTEQRKLQQAFAKYTVQWFYERKDGQFDGMVSFHQKTPGFRPGDYQITPGKKKYRAVDNEALAKQWLAFLGLSDRTLRGGLDIFGNDEYYKLAFLTHPNEEYWKRVRRSPGNEPPAGEDGCVAEGPPSVSQYLLAHLVYRLLRHRKVSFQRNRADAVQRLVERGQVDADTAGKPRADALEVERKLNGDEIYYVNTVINNMQDVLVELIAMLLCCRYGPLNDEVCRRILEYPPIRRHVEDPLAQVPQEANESNNRHILNLCYEFCRFSLQQYIVKYGDAMKAQPRLKSHLAQRSTINKLRVFFLEVDKEKVPTWVAPWCPEKCAFLKQLPDLTQ